ncbi:MAG: transporter substrate-binding domain-containing protein [Lactobacillaceae bacterium]|nr:transporter substrate-binding domain-containing protein [Lactobacillaceae bacterium]
MKKISIAAMAAITLLGTTAPVFGSVNASAASTKTIKKGTLTVGLEGTYAPFSYRKDGKLTGYDVQVAKAVAKKLGLKVKYVQTKWDSLIAGLDANRYDVVFNNVGKTAERAKAYTFSKPYMYSHTVMILPSDSKLKTLKDIKGKAFAQSTSSNFGQIAKKAGATIISVPGFTEAASLIESGRAEGTLNDLGAYQIWRDENKDAKVKSVDMDKYIKPVGSYPLLKKGNTSLQKKINKAITQLKKDGTLKKLSEKFFKADLTSK